VHRGQLFRKYFLLILGLVCGALLISGGIGLYFAYQENKEALASLQREKAAGAAARIEQFVSQIEQQLAFAALPQLGAEGLEQRRIEFLKLLRVVPAVTDIAQIDAKGREQLAVSRLKMDTAGANEDRSQEPAFKNARPGQTWFGPVYFRKETEPYMSIAVRSGGESGPVTVAEVNLKFIWDVVTKIRIGQKGKAYVVDSTGHLVADPDIGLVLRKTNLSHLEQVKAAFARGADESHAMLAKDLAGSEVLTAYAPIEPAREQAARGAPASTLGWKVFVEQPASEMYAALDATLWRTVALIVAGLVFSALAALWLARNMVRPISVLQEGAQRIGEGDLEQKIDIRTGDELEALASQFNHMTEQLRESYAGLERKVEERTAELTESLAYQTATGEILQVISSSPTNVQPVFDVIAERAARLCEANYGWVFTFDGEWIRVGSLFGSDPQSVEVFRREFPMRSSTESVVARTIRKGSIDHVPDVLADPEYALKRAAEQAGFRGALGVPMMREGQVVGAITVARSEPGLFSDKRVELLKTFASQAVIAIENVRLFNETKEALERQTATAEILKVISSTPTDVQPVFDAIVRNAVTLCDAKFASAFRYDGERLHFLASTSPDEKFVQALKEAYPLRPDRSQISGRTILSKSVERLEDALADPEYRSHIAVAGSWRRMLGVPLLRDGNPIGAIVVGWEQAGPIAPVQEQLLKTFADQAVIAVENVRLFNETKEALERQTATSDILRVISSSTTDVQPVFDAIVQSGLKLFPDALVSVALPDHDGQVRLAAVAARDPAECEEWRKRFPFPLSRAYMHGVALLERRLFDVPDVAANTDPELAAGIKNFLASGLRAQTTMPMMRGDTAIGAISVVRRTPGPLTDKQIALLRIFADQAVIAIENVRLFNETKESLEQQTAISEILRVISSSPGDVQPVLQAVAERAARICDAKFSDIIVVEGQAMRVAAAIGDLGRPQSGETVRLDRTTVMGRSVIDKTSVHIADLQASGEEFPLGRKLALEYGHRTILAMPLMREDKALGTILLRRTEVRPFEEKHVALLRTFADQAAIAIENARLFNETKESLEQQTATSEILRVISDSPADVKPILQAVAERATRLCDTASTAIYVLEDGVMRRTAFHGPSELMGRETVPYTKGTLAGRAIVEGKPIHVHDIESAQAEYPISWEFARQFGRKQTMLAVPLLREGRPFGTMFLRRREVRPFSDKQIALSKVFADQAAIGIENVRLFNETKEALEQQKASAEVLSAISSSIADTQPVFDRIARNCEHLFAGVEVIINLIGDDGLFYIVGHQGAHRDHLERNFKGAPVSRDSGAGRCVIEKRSMQYPDIEYGDDVPPALRANCAATDVKACMYAPLVWEDRGIGAIFVGRRYKGPFSEKEMGLLKTFADQAVIAIQNSRLFREIQEKSAQLEVANKHKSDFLANMSHELRTPLNAIIGFSEVLSERMFGEINEKQADYLKDIHESGKHLLSLINDILDLSKIEAGRMDLEISTFDLPSALSNAMTLVRERAQRHGIELALDVDKQLGSFQADERKFKQIVLNLLSNAVKFTPDGGRVSVSAKKDTTHVEIAVKDTGIGIAPEDQAAVFEEFKQVGRDYTKKAEGTGLGLTLTKRFVELHGGEIRLESTLGKGSTFTITLPLR
jgi:GAF domain-containing protein/sensor histidine kinase YesM